MKGIQAPLIGVILAAFSPLLFATEKTGPFGTREESASAPGLVMPLAISRKHITQNEQAQSEALIAKLKALYAVLERAPMLQSPRGFSVEPQLKVSANEQARGKPLGGELLLSFRPIHLHWTSTRFDSESGRYFTPYPTDGISFWINHPASLLSHDELGRDAQGSFHNLIELTDRGNGWYEHRDHRYHRLVYYDNGRKPYRTVTLERYMKYLIDEARQQVAEAAGDSPAWIDYAAGGTAGPTREELLAELAQTEKGLIAGGMGRAQVEAMMKPMRENLASYQPPLVDKSGIAETSTAGESSSGEYLQALEAELAALSPQQRQAPACQYLGEPKLMPVSGLDLQCTDPKGVIVEINPNFFDRKRPQGEVQLLTINYFPKRGGGKTFDYLDIAQSVMDSVRQADVLAALR